MCIGLYCSKHESVILCLFYAGPTSQKVGQLGYSIVCLQHEQHAWPLILWLLYCPYHICFFIYIKHFNVICWILSFTCKIVYYIYKIFTVISVTQHWICDIISREKMGQHIEGEDARAYIYI